jgi:hypothetical protein
MSDEPPYVLINLKAGAEGLWWLGPCPWPGLPASREGVATADPQTWRCCPEQPPGRIVAVELHLPRNPREPACTVVVEVAEGTLDHYARRHGFDVG